MKARIYILSLLVLVFYSCKKEQSLNDQIDNVVVVNAFLEVDQPISGLKFTGLDPLGYGQQVNPDDLYCEIIQGNNVYPLTRDDKGCYNHIDQSVMVMADTGYELKVTGKDKIIRAYATTPREVLDVSLTKTIINTELAFDQIDVEFEESQGVEVFYLIKIELEDKSTAVPIEFPNDTNSNPKSAFIYNGNQSIIPILASYFEFYGSHTVTIERINDIYFDLYKDTYDQDSFLDAGNIINGKGIFMGKDKFSFTVDVL